MAQNLTYTQCGDYNIPDIRLMHTEAQALGKYGRMRRTFLEHNNPILFNDMVLTETLFPHLWEIQETATARMEQMMEELTKKNGVTEEMKSENPMQWVQTMNRLHAEAEEQIVNGFLK